MVEKVSPRPTMSLVPASKGLIPPDLVSNQNTPFFTVVNQMFPGSPKNPLLTTLPATYLIASNVSSLSGFLCQF
jgi:hypothetical protein